MPKFTIKLLDSLEPKDRIYRLADDQCPGLKVAVYPSGVKSFKVIKRTKGGRPVTVTLGRYPGMTIHTARQKAIQALDSISSGDNPNRSEVCRLTLDQAFSEYLDNRDLKRNTIDDYRRVRAQYMKDWLNRQLADITPDDVTRKYQSLSQRSVARANNAMRVFRAVYNYAYATQQDTHRKPLLPENPVNVLSTSRQWKKVRRKKSVIRAADLPSWFKSLNKVPLMRTENAGIYHAYITLMLFTGLRGSELRLLATCPDGYADLKGDGAKGYYDSREELLYYYDQKNGEEQEIPLSTHAVKAIHGVHKGSPGWLFKTKNGRITYNAVKEVFNWISQDSGIKATGHDLRRTFITVAENMDMSPYTYKRLVGQKIDNSNDVTAGYVVSGKDRLRNAAQSIGDVIAGYATS